MKVLVINCGSSSLKYQLLDMTNEQVITKGMVDRIGLGGSILKLENKLTGESANIETPMNDHREAFSEVMIALTDPKIGAIKSPSEIGAIGHRVVHAGEAYSESVIISPDVIKVLEDCIELAPLHNPANLQGIAACQALMPGTPNIAVFDTAFHQTMPPSSYMYALPYEYYEEYRVRRYGFHGTSHKYVTERAAAVLGRSLDELKIVTCHLGNGASVAAIKNGKCVDTSMGLTPLEGLVMGTRSGDIDPAIIPFIAEKKDLDAAGVINVLNKNSGVLGLSGVSSDFRDIEEAERNGNERARLALDVYAHRVKFYIGAYMAEMNGLDAIVFTAGVGENDSSMRALICSDMDNIGIKIDDVANDVSGKEAVISAPDSKVKLLLIPTDEELVIARDTYALVK